MKMITRMFAACLALSLGLGGCGRKSAAWSYDGRTGPEHWGDLSREFALAKTGREQSPIDITAPRPANLQAIVWNYRPSALAIRNNRYTIEVHCEPGSFIRIDGIRYDLRQFHFHSPSENTVDGKHFDLEMHLVHEDDLGNLAVVAVFLEQGAVNDEFRSIWRNLPAEPGGRREIDGAMVDAGRLLPRNRSYHRFRGSLTTPPCTQNVKWLVMQRPVNLSLDQIEAFRAIYHGNNRPVQPLNDRIVLSDR